jgi:hypothetical protein
VGRLEGNMKVGKISNRNREAVRSQEFLDREMGELDYPGTIVGDY